MPTTEELRAAMEVVERPGNYAPFTEKCLAAAVRELYEALESAEDIVQFDRGLSDEPEILKRYRSAMEGGKDE